MWRPNPAYNIYPTASSSSHQHPSSQTHRQRTILNITDKSGNKINLTRVQPEKKENTFAKQMREQAEQALKDNVGIRKKREEEERLKREREAREKAERERVEREAKERAEREAREKAEREAREKAEREAREKAEREAKERAEREVREKAEREAKERAERLAREKAEKEAKERMERDRAEREAREKAMAAAKQKSTPSLRPGGPSLRPGGASLRPGAGGSSLRPGGPALRPGGAALRPGGGQGLRPGGKKPMMSPPTPIMTSAGTNIAIRSSNSRLVYSKSELLSFRDSCTSRPDDLPDRTIRVKKKPDQWRPRQGDNDNNNRKQWDRGVKQAPYKDKNRRRNRDNNNNNNRYNDQILEDVPKLKKGENRWVPVKSTSAFDVAEKKVKSILNKMTKEKFERLAGQMIDIQILSYEMLQMMIHNVYEKAIQEPAFGDMYADLCIKLSQKAISDEFIHLIESDEDVPLDQPPSADGTSWRWSNDVSVDDTEVVGPYESVDECVDVAVEGSDDVNPIKREKTLTLECLKIVQGVFVKVLKGEEEGQYYMVFFPQEEAGKSGQQMSGIFGNVEKCKSDAAKQNSFKRTLLNKCEDEFNKQDIYVDWKKEKKEYDKSKSKLTEDERVTKQEELDFRRMKIKKQMLGNIKFIGELYKKSMIRENIMHYCINSLLKFDKLNDGRIIDRKDDEMDEEDHEAVCKLFTTIGKTIDKEKNKVQMKAFFKKIVALSQDKKLPSRSRFMYKDLLELRANKWKLRREQETAKTLQEIKKDFLKEEKQAERESSGYRGGGGGGRGDRNNSRNDYRQSYTSGNYQSQSRRKMVEQSADGFMTVVGKGKSFRQTSQPPQQSLRPQVITKAAPPPVVTAPPPPKTAAVPPLSVEKLQHMIKSMRQEYLADPTNLEDLTYSMEKFATTPNAAQTVVKINVEFALDCKDTERQGVIDLLTTLYDKKYLAKTDFDAPCEEIVEFIDSFAVDVPFAHRYVGQMLAVFIPKGLLSIDWFLGECSKIFTKEDKNKLMKEVYNALNKDNNKFFAGKDAAVVAVVGPEAWSEISGN